MIVQRIVEFGAGGVEAVLFFLIWRTTRVGGFAALAGLRVANLVNWLLVMATSSAGMGIGVSLFGFVGMALSIGYVAAVWNVYTHMKRIWAPVETPAAGGTAS